MWSPLCEVLDDGGPSDAELADMSSYLVLRVQTEDMCLLRSLRNVPILGISVTPSAPMNLNLLPLFTAVAEAVSFSEAATQLGLRRSSVSRGVASLEKALDVQLFNRTTRQVSLTSAGKALYAKLAPRLGELKEVLGTLPEQEEEPAGTLRVSVPNDLGAMVLPELFAGFSLRYPAVRLDVRVSNRKVNLVSEGFDVALRIAVGRLTDSSLVARRLATLEVQVFAAPSYLARVGTPKSPEEAALLDWVLSRTKLPAPLLSPRVARALGDDMLFIAGAARAGLGLAVLPVFLTRDDVAAGRLMRVLPKISISSGALFLVHTPGRVARKVSAFRDYLLLNLPKSLG